jgi:alkaline phosphatase
MLAAGYLLTACLGQTSKVLTFGIVTDVHYANATSAGTRFYEDSLNKMKDATASISAANADFLIELGDFKDTTKDQNFLETVEFLEDIEHGLGSYTGDKVTVTQSNNASLQY